MSVWGQNRASGGLAQRLRVQQEQAQAQAQASPAPAPPPPRPLWTPVLPPHTSPHHHYHHHHHDRRLPDSAASREEADHRSADGTFAPPMQLTRDNSTVIVALVAFHARSNHVLLAVDDEQPNEWYLPTVCVSVDASASPTTIVDAVRELTRVLHAPPTSASTSTGNNDDCSSGPIDGDRHDSFLSTARFLSIEHYPTLRSSWLRFSVAIALDSEAYHTADELTAAFVHSSASTSHRFFPLDDVLNARVALSSADVLRVLELLQPSKEIKDAEKDSDATEGASVVSTSTTTTTIAASLTVATAPLTSARVARVQHEFPYLLVSIALVTPRSVVLVRHPLPSANTSASSWWSLPVTHVDKGETLTFCVSRFARALFGLSVDDTCEHVAYVEESPERSPAAGPSLRYAGYRLTCFIDVSKSKRDPNFVGKLRAERLPSSSSASSASETSTAVCTAALAPASASASIEGGGGEETDDDDKLASLTSTVPHTYVSRAQLHLLKQQGQLRDGLLDCLAEWLVPTPSVRTHAALLSIQPESSNVPQA